MIQTNGDSGIRTQTEQANEQHQQQQQPQQQQQQTATSYGRSADQRSQKDGLQQQQQSNRTVEQQQSAGASPQSGAPLQLVEAQDSARLSGNKRKLRHLEPESRSEDEDLPSADDEPAGSSQQANKPQTAPATTTAQPREPQLTNADNNDRPKRNPFCSRCRNHGKSAQVKGHKRHCEYRDCQCGGCKLVECRQLVSAAQIRRRRYQKQDEECGRTIEISPPVLKREPSNDPAAIIAKTLVGSSEILSPKHSLHLGAAAGVSGGSGASASASGHPTSIPAVVSAAAATQPVQAPAIPINQHRLLPQPGQSLLHAHHPHYPHYPDSSDALSSAPTQAVVANPELPSLAAANQPNLAAVEPFNNAHHLHHAHHYLNFQHNQHSNQSHLHLTPGGHQVPTSVAASLSDPQAVGAAQNHAFHLLNHPGSMLSHVALAQLSNGSSNQVGSNLGAPAASALQQLSLRAKRADSGPVSPPQLTSSATDHNSHASIANARDQMSIVEEIYYVYGPIAIYAWLKSERFDLHKVRDMIENSRPSYNSCLEVKLSSTKLSLNSSNQNISLENNTSSCNNSSSNSRSNDINSSNFHQTSHNYTCANGLSDTSRSSSNSSSNGSVECNKSDQRNPNISDQIDKEHLLHQQHNQNHPNSNSNSKLANVPPTSLSMTLNRLATSSSPLHAALTSNYCNNGGASFMGGSNDNHVNSAAAAAAAAAAVARYNIPQSTPMNTLPTTSAAQSLLWSGLKLTSNGVANSVIHPHLLSPFIHHPFLPHQAYNHHHHHRVPPAAVINNPSTDKTLH